MNKISIIHLIPENRVGGVENAAKSFFSHKNDLLNFSVDYIFADNEAALVKRYSLSQLIKILIKARQISKISPDVVILSLWRSCLCGLFIKLFKPKIKLITFLHSCNDVHILEFFATRIIALFSMRIFADSQATMTERISWLPSKKMELISFLIKNESQQLSKKVTPSFIFWGRLSKEKGLDTSINFFYEIYKKYPNATFKIIGPDCGIMDQLKDQIKFLKIESAVSFSGVLSTPEIAKCASDASFYLQASLFEGMGMSVVEAMQLGLVPIVTPVGQIAFYCKDGYNAVFINRNDSIGKVILLLEDNKIYQCFRYNSISLWKDQTSYSESMTIACENISRLLKND
jgi:glycosyltransferase involved in cell wall biosynthesis